MDAAASVASDRIVMSSFVQEKEAAAPAAQASIFPFLKLPRELRDQIYNYAFSIPDNRGERALRIERRNLKYFSPSAAAILLLLHHEYFLLNRQVAREALEILFKNHTVFLSCGPYVLKSVFERIEAKNGPEKQWLKWIKSIELEWVTFPNLRCYPPNREDGRDEWYWEQQDEIEVDVDYVRGAAYSGHYDEYDYEGGYYDDNFYDPGDTSLYPNFQPPPNSATQPTNTNDPFDLANHYPFADPRREPTDESEAQEDIATKLDLLISLEVTPLFAYFASSTLNLSSMTLPLYFISKPTHQYRSASRPDYTLPLKIRYWVKVCVHALIMLTSSPTTLDEIRVKYLPWDIWASMDPADNLHRITKQGIWFNKPSDWADGGDRAGEGEAFRAVWAELQDRGLCTAETRMGLRADIKFVKWQGDLDKWRVGDELEVVFTRGSEAIKRR